MNGSLVMTKSPFVDVRLSLDPVTLDAGLGKRKVRAIEADGNILYDEEKTTNNHLTEQLERVWNEYPNGLLDIKETELEESALFESAVKEREDGDPVEKERDPFKMMSRNEMDQLRTDVHESLNAARNELWFVLELAKTLSASSGFTNQAPPTLNQKAATPNAGPKRGKNKAAVRVNEADAKSSLPTSISMEPPVLPPGTFSVTPSSMPVKPTYTQVHEMELVLAAKQRALDECSSLIDSAVSELQMMAVASERFWEDVGILRNGNGGTNRWAVVPKPDFGRTMQDGEKSKDIIIPYAIDEAPRAIRARSLAAFDLDPTKEDALTFGARSHLRLRVTLKDISGAMVGSTPDSKETARDVKTQMEVAQMEAFDEDLFSQLRYEASRLKKSEIDMQSISLSVAEYTLTFELFDTRISTSTPVSPLCDVIVSSARLNLINLHRHRKAKLVSPIHSDLNAPILLSPIIHALSYRQLCNVVHSTFENFAKTFTSAGLIIVTDRRMSASESSSAAIYDMLLGRVDADTLSEVHTFQLSGCPGIRICTTAPFKTNVRLSNANFEVSNPAELSHILSTELATQLLRWVTSEIRNKIPDHSISSSLFLDELEGVMHLGQKGSFRISLPPPFHSILCNVVYSGETNISGSDSLKLNGYDSRLDGDLHHWIDEVVQMLTLSGT
ncbi:uncharacterized protein IL334_000163 [Kwoniella shivajii]|uniref:Mediator of RNA polymerase II transcription subunit 17 n=1 Tax=Kwoniella shivajii TaxID=564305 RepID=A0ABZ1CPX7_9TREE|nr:hypothetical protein IL334_000163 [Kwoniella shivajii]